MIAPIKRLIRWLALLVATVVASFVGVFLLARVLDTTGTEGYVALAVLLTVMAVSVGLLLWAIALKIGFRRIVLGTSVIVAVTGLWVAYSTVIWRDTEYWRTTEGFRTASVIAKRADPDLLDNTGWNEVLLIAGGLRVTIRAAPVRDVATVQYSDEVSPSNLFSYRDYTNVMDVRRKGDVLYVLRSITLVGSETRLTVFDLARREVIADRRVGSDDVRSD